MPIAHLSPDDPIEIQVSSSIAGLKITRTDLSNTVSFTVSAANYLTISAALLYKSYSQITADAISLSNNLGLTGSTYLRIGGTENSGTSHFKAIGFGYTGTNYQPAYFAYQETTSTANTCGDLVFYTRSVTTDSVPIERFRITAAGLLLAQADPTTALGLATKQFVENSYAAIQPAAVASVISGFTYYTPTFTNFTLGNGSCAFKWRREGNMMRITGPLTIGSTSSFTASAFQFSLPSDYTTDLATGARVGTIVMHRPGTGPREIFHIVHYGSNKFAVEGMDSAGGIGAWSSSYPATWLTNYEIHILDMLIPITQWASNINLVKDFTEYAYNTSTSTTDDLTSFGYGQTGVLVKAFAPAATSFVTKRVRFTQSIKNTDLIILEGIGGTPNAAGMTTWRKDPWPFIAWTSSAYQGVQIVQVNDTDVDVQFASRPSGPNTWADFTTAMWRLRKISNGNFAQGSCAFSKQVGDGSSTTIDVVHGLQTEDVIIFVREAANLKREIDCTKRVIDSNTIRLTDFITAPTLNSLQVFVGTNGGTTGVTSDTQEFASNSSSTNADDTTSFAYGPNGSTGIIGVIALTARRAKRVRFKTTIKSTDIIQIEIFNGIQWQLLGDGINFDNGTYIGPFAKGGLIGTSSISGTSAGIHYQIVNDTDVDVFFGRSCLNITNQSQDSPIDWDNTNIVSNQKWRLRKISAGNFSQIVTDSYSTNEVATNKTWIDGKTIYRKVIDLGTLPNNTNKTLSHNIVGHTLFTSISGMAKSSSGLSRPLPYATTTLAANIYLYANDTSVIVGSDNDYSSYTGYAILEYTNKGASQWQLENQNNKKFTI